MFGEKHLELQTREIERLRNELAQRDAELAECKDLFRKVLERPTYALMTDTQIRVLADLLKDHLDGKKEYLN